MKKIAKIASGLGAMLLPCAALAQGALERLNTVQGAAQLPSGSLEETIGYIINIILSLVGVILVVLIVYAGFLWMTAGGDSKKVDTAKTIMTNSIIGLVIVLLAYGIANFVLTSLLQASGTT